MCESNTYLFLAIMYTIGVYNNAIMEKKVAYFVSKIAQKH